MSRFKGIYWRQFILTVGMVALTLVLLGTSFFALTYSYIISEKRGELEDKAQVIAQLAVGAYNKPDMVLSLRSKELMEIMDVAQRMSDTDFLPHSARSRHNIFRFPIDSSNVGPLLSWSADKHTIHLETQYIHP